MKLIYIIKDIIIYIIRKMPQIDDLGYETDTEIKDYKVNKKLNVLLKYLKNIKF